MSNLNDVKTTEVASKEKRYNPLLAKKEAMDKLLFRKRDAFYDFFSSKLSMIFLIVLSAVLVFSLINILSTTIVEIKANELGLNIIIAAINLVLAFFVPVGFAFVYFGSKKRNAEAIKSGMRYIDQYFNFVRLLAVLTGIIVIIFMLVATVWGGFVKALVFLLCLAVVIVSVYILNIFKKFVVRISTEFNREYTFFPNAKKIQIYTIVVCCVYLLYIVLSIVVFADDLIATYSELEDLLSSTATSKIFSYIAFVLNASILGFLLYYVGAYNKSFKKFNQEHQQIIDQKH